MDSRVNQPDIENIGDLIRHSKVNYNAFKTIREKLAKPISSSEYSKFLQSLTEHVHEFTANHIKQLLLGITNTYDWMICEHPGVSVNMMNLYVASISYFPYFVDDICEYYVKQVLYLKDCIEQLVNNRNCSHLNIIAVEFFTILCQNAPNSVSIIVDILIKRFPNWRKPTNELIWATYSVLSLISSKKSSKLLSHTDKCNMISVIFTTVIDLELNPDGINHENLLPLFENTPINTAFQKFDKSMLETNINVLFNSIQNSIVIDKNWLKLELLCWLLMSYISSICVKTDNTPSLEFDWDLLCSIFRRARDIFSEHILPVNIYLSAYPMICFYMCSLRGGLVISFVDFLWNAVKDEHRDQGSRLMALSYLCFLLVNGKFCFIDLVLEIMHDMATWCIDYTYRHRRLLTGAHTNLLSSDNKIYYGTCDILVYIFVQLHCELLNPEHFESCNRLPIAQISISPFKPMLNMSEELRRAFFQIISAYHLSWSTIGLTQSLCDRNNHQMKNDSLLTVEVIRSLKPSKVFHMPENKCALSLSSAVINGLFRNINLGECMISSQQDISVSKDNHYNSHNIVSSISPRRKKRKASTIGETEGITSELQSSKSYEESV